MNQVRLNGGLGIKEKRRGRRNCQKEKYESVAVRGKEKEEKSIQQRDISAFQRTKRKDIWVKQVLPGRSHFSFFFLGDVIVEINGKCVLGKTHPEVVQMFQSIPINQYVDMVLCRGYQLPPDVDLDSDEPLPPPPLPPGSQPQQPLHGGEVVTAVPLINGQPLLVKGDVLHGSSQDLHYVTMDASGRPVVAAIPNGRQGEREDAATAAAATTAAGAILQPELVSVSLVKGPGGFGFAIADCPLGQKVKMILDAQWCRGLQKGDIIKEINRQNVQTLTHAQVVDILKDLPVGSEVNVVVLRGGESFFS